MNLPSLEPGKSALVTGDYGTGKTTFIAAWAQSIGRGAFWAAPPRSGAKPDYADFAVVVHTATEMEAAARKAPFVVWPSPPSSAGREALLSAYNDFCRIAMRFHKAVVVTDEFQRITADSKRLSDLPPACQDLVELGHKKPNQLAKVWAAHRLAQIPLTFGAGAYRVSTRPFPGDERALEPAFGREAVQRMKSFGIGDFAFWSAEQGAVLPCRLEPRKAMATPRGPSGPSLDQPPSPPVEGDGIGQ